MYSIINNVCLHSQREREREARPHTDQAGTDKLLFFIFHHIYKKVYGFVLKGPGRVYFEILMKIKSNFS